MTNYTRLTEINRNGIERGILEGFSRRKIASRIDKHFSSVSREIKRNGGYLRYYAVRAQERAKKSNKKDYSKIERYPELKAYIIDKLRNGWSPKVIAGRLKLEKAPHYASAEAIYTWIYSEHARELKLYELLPRSKKKRGMRKVRPGKNITNKVSIHDRPQEINDRIELGHQEMDLVFQQGNSSQNILTSIERKSRFVHMKKNSSKHANVINQSIKGIQENALYPIKSVTFDNGSEFANHAELGVNTYFCDKGAPWQKGSIENYNGMLRRQLDYRVPIETVTQDMLDSIALRINNTPRQILGFLTPFEVLKNSYREKSDSVAFYS